MLGPYRFVQKLQSVAFRQFVQLAILLLFVSKCLYHTHLILPIFCEYFLRNSQIHSHSTVLPLQNSKGTCQRGLKYAG